MKKIAFIVEKTETGYSAYSDDFDLLPIGSTAKTITELKSNILDALNTYNELKGLPESKEEDIAIKVDFKQLFTYFGELNAKALSKRSGINPTLLSQYINGHKEVSVKQANKIIESIRELGKELTELELV